jgi:PhzF family phenazine biosynthesis protein
MRIYQVDSFTTKPFSGNPAGVVIADRELPAAWMQLVAAEMNLAETAFAVRESAASFHLRWFTPTVEVDLCGHATLAAAHILWEEGVVPSGTELVFRTLSGELRATGGAGSVELDFPSEPPAPATAPEGMLESLGIEKPVYVGRNRMDYLIEVEHEADVRGLRPDLFALAKFDTRGVIVTARSSAPEIDFVSRFFAPACGVPEDPVTGSAHCALAPYWGDKLNKQQMRGFQASARGGIVDVRVAGARVILIGNAVTVIRGEIADPAA